MGSGHRPLNIKAIRGKKQGRQPINPIEENAHFENYHFENAHFATLRKRISEENAHFDNN